MSEKVAEGIYVKESSGKLGIGITAKEALIETFWFPRKVNDGFVEMMLVTDKLDRVLNLREKVPIGSLHEHYILRKNSKELYHKLRKSLSGF